MKKYIMMSLAVIGASLVVTPAVTSPAFAGKGDAALSKAKGKKPVRAAPKAPVNTKRHKAVRIGINETSRLKSTFTPGSRKAVRLPEGVNASRPATAAGGSGGGRRPTGNSVAKGHYVDYMGRAQKKKSVRAGGKTKIAQSAKPGKAGTPPRRASVASERLGRLQRTESGGIRGVTARPGTAARVIQENRALDPPRNIRPVGQPTPSATAQASQPPARTASGQPLQVRQTGTVSIWSKVKRFFSSKPSSAQNSQR